jgi:hypothetical protein
MRFKPPKRWEQETVALFIHDSGVRIERRLYREKEGWFLIPTDLDQEVIGFDPTPEGRDHAFAAFAEGCLIKPRKKNAVAVESMAKPKRGRKPKKDPEEDSEVDPEEAMDAGGPPEGKGKTDDDS